MGKITSIYLTDEEAEELKRFCSENNCTQYSALKTALKEVLARPPTRTEEEICEKTEESEPEITEDAAEERRTEEARRKELSTILKALRALKT